MLKLHPFPRASWKKCHPWASKTARGPIGPWAVLEALGRHFFQNVSGKGGILYQNGSKLPMNIKSLFLSSTDVIYAYLCPMCVSARFCGYRVAVMVQPSILMPPPFCSSESESGAVAHAVAGWLRLLLRRGGHGAQFLWCQCQRARLRVRPAHQSRACRPGAKEFHWNDQGT